MNLGKTKSIEKLDEILQELSQYRAYSHDSLLTHFINERLAESLKHYDIELEKNISYLSNQVGMKVLKAIAKKAKQDDKAIIETYFED